MKFRTEIDIPQGSFSISHSDRGLLLGSCFAENIGRKMKAAGFRLEVNPFGVLYNPHSVASSLSMLAEKRSMTAKDLASDNGLWYSFLFHGSFSGTCPDTVLAGMNESLNRGSSALLDADYIIITLGTAWVYTHNGSGIIVSNCHKRPAREFDRRRMSVEEIIARFAPLLEGPLTDKQVLFTVSPIRHLKDGLTENQLSKATLTVAVHELETHYNNVSYFPSYEIMLDDLRDYRFYDRDMVHPSEQAVEYIWDHFSLTYFSAETRKLSERIENINKAMGHRPLNPDTPQHRAFVADTLRKLEQLKAEHPEIDIQPPTRIQQKK